MKPDSLCAFSAYLNNVCFWGQIFPITIRGYKTERVPPSGRGDMIYVGIGSFCPWESGREIPSIDKSVVLFLYVTPSP